LAGKGSCIVPLQDGNCNSYESFHTNGLARFPEGLHAMTKDCRFLRDYALTYFLTGTKTVAMIDTGNLPNGERSEIQYSSTVNGRYGSTLKVSVSREPSFPVMNERRFNFVPWRLTCEAEPA
jgi:hypothetical protein